MRRGSECAKCKEDRLRIPPTEEAQADWLQGKLTSAGEASEKAPLDDFKIDVPVEWERPDRLN